MVEAHVHGSYWKSYLLIILGLVILVVNALVQFNHLNYNLYLSSRNLYMIGAVLLVLGSLLRFIERGRVRSFQRRI